MSGVRLRPEQWEQLAEVETAERDAADVTRMPLLWDADQA